MAFRYIDGFDHESLIGLDPTLVYKGPTGTLLDGTFVNVSDFPKSSSFTPYGYGRCVAIVGLCSLTKILDNQSTWLVGFHYTWTTAGSSSLLVLLDNSVIQLTLYYNVSTNKFEIYQGNPTTNLLGSSIHTFSINTWYWIELKVLINSSVGTVELRVNGISEITLTAGDQNTQKGINAYANYICLKSLTTWTYFDNLIIQDGVGGCDFTGECRVATLYPASDSSIAWTKSTGANNFGCVDEAQMNTTDYVSSNTPGQIDKYGFGALGILGDVKGVQVCVLGKKDDAAPHSLRTYLRTEATDYSGDTQNLDSVYRTFTKLYPTNPQTGIAWTIAEVDAALAGVELVS